MEKGNKTKIKVLAVDNSASQIAMLKEYFNDNNKIEIINHTLNEEDVTKILSEGKDIDVMIIDLTNLESLIFNFNPDKEHNYIDKYLQTKLTNILHTLGIPSHIKGFQYVKSAILMVYDNPKYIGRITKELYPQISFKFNTSIQRVERAIRHAIEISCNRGNYDLIEEIFGYSLDNNKAKPTNSEFIVTIADRLRFDMINK